MACLVDDLRRQKELLRVVGGCIQDGGQRPGDGLLSDEEHRVVPESCFSLPFVETVVPVVDIRREVNGRRAPVVLLPQPVETVVADYLWFFEKVL